ncbi:YugN-like family protein [Halobacillus litoralis]|uniref:YugN-like family protein n=1 Tax=Halobacillus litoralis TaxID=45668 RepID=UPI001CD5835F|nr:YugN-like family protein [Halobacillus litoralis]MCA1023983.1 YugN-like family protein [Halobacillus litoralis]
MIPLTSSLTGQVFSFQDAEAALKTVGFKLADNWDYEHGYFDYKIDDRVGYQFIRLPFVVTSGSLDAPSDYAMIEMTEPFLLSHKYNPGLDDNVKEGNIRAIFDQFQEPVDKDATFPEEHIQSGQELLQAAEEALLSQR